MQTTLVASPTPRNSPGLLKVAPSSPGFAGALFLCGRSVECDGAVSTPLSLPSKYRFPETETDIGEDSFVWSVASIGGSVRNGHFSLPIGARHQKGGDRMRQRDFIPRALIIARR